MLYKPIIGVVKVHAAMIGENRKLTFEVPYFCSKNKPIRITADRASTTAVILKGRISLLAMPVSEDCCNYSLVTAVKPLTLADRRKWPSQPFNR